VLARLSKQTLSCQEIASRLAQRSTGSEFVLGRAWPLHCPSSPPNSSTRRQQKHSQV